MGKSYYYLIAGLSELSLDDSKLPVSLQEFREEVYSALSSRDRKLMDLLLLENDCRALMALLSTGKVPGQTAQGLFSADQLEELIAQVKAQDKPGIDVPAFMCTFIQEWMDGSWQDSAGFAEDRLWGLFYEYATSASNEFVRDWYMFNLNLNNVQAAFTARKYGLDIQKLVVGTDSVAQALRTSGARDWGLSQELDCFDDMARLQDEPDLSIREQKTDMLRWNWLEENTFFHYFTVERLFSYMIRLGMVERWTALDRERGQQLFRELIGSLKDQTQVPDEFKIQK